MYGIFDRNGFSASAQSSNRAKQLLIVDYNLSYGFAALLPRFPV